MIPSDIVESLKANFSSDDLGFAYDSHNNVLSGSIRLHFNSAFFIFRFDYVEMLECDGCQREYRFFLRSDSKNLAFALFHLHA